MVECKILLVQKYICCPTEGLVVPSRRPPLNGGAGSKVGQGKYSNGTTPDPE